MPSSAVRKGSLCIAIPCRGSIPDEAFSAILAACLMADTYWRKVFGQDALVVTRTAMKCQVADARENIAEYVLQEGLEWVLWMDDDALPEPDILQRLHESGKSWIVPAFFRRLPDYRPCLFYFEETGGVPKIVEADVDPPRLYKIDAAGFHTMLMHRDVIVAAREATPATHPIFVKLPAMGEDIYFCMHAQKGGQQLWADSRVEVGHVGTIAVRRGLYKAYRDTGSSVVAARAAVAEHAPDVAPLVR